MKFMIKFTIQNPSAQPSTKYKKKQGITKFSYAKIINKQSSLRKRIPVQANVPDNKIKGDKQFMQSNKIIPCIEVKNNKFL